MLFYGIVCTGDMCQQSCIWSRLQFDGHVMDDSARAMLCLLSTHRLLAKTERHKKPCMGTLAATKNRYSDMPGLILGHLLVFLTLLVAV